MRPRRTIRVALWGGEEEGLLGSQAYVKQHFGTFEEPKPEYAKLVAYFNIDSGTGRARGASVFGPPEAASIVRTALAPFEDLAGWFGNTDDVFGDTASEKGRRASSTAIHQLDDFIRTAA